MGLSTTHLLILLAIVVLLFGAGRISGVMSEFGKGIKSFKKGLSDEDDASKKAEAQKAIEASPAKPVDRATVESSKVG